MGNKQCCGTTNNDLRQDESRYASGNKKGSGRKQPIKKQRKVDSDSKQVLSASPQSTSDENSSFVSSSNEKKH